MLINASSPAKAILFSQDYDGAQESEFATATVTYLDSYLAIQRGLVPGHDIINKFGRNTDVDTGVVEDVWNGGGVYTGFPTGAAETFEAFSSSVSDTGVLTITYLPSFTSTEYETASVTLNGTTPVSFGVSGVRMHTARYDSGNSTTFNVGTITVRHTVTTANVFCVMPIGRSQTNVAAYTVPFGHTGYIVRLFSRLIGGTTGFCEGALWIREKDKAPRLRRPFTVAQQEDFEENPAGGLVIPALTDVMVRLQSASANNLDVIGGYDIIIMRDYP
jgi:hypothetical protein